MFYPGIFILTFLYPAPENLQQLSADPPSSMAPVRHSSLFLLIFEFHHLASASTSYQSYSTNEIWSKSGVSYTRPPWSGTVNIVYDDTEIWHVAGVVIPCSTTGRPSAPNPYNGYDTGTDLQLDKGHLMALSNGGPDIKRNIVPQGSFWQVLYIKYLCSCTLK